MKWTIINSIDLAKIYPITNTKIFVTDGFKNKIELTKFFDSFKIPYYLSKTSSSQNETIYFGSEVEFNNLYIIAGILKSYGFNELVFKSTLKEKITLGSIKRKTISSNNISIPIDAVLDQPFNMTFEQFAESFNLYRFEKIDLDEYYRQNGWEIPNSIVDKNIVSEKDEDFEDDEIDDEQLLKEVENSNNEIDPYENFHYGGLSGEEAHTAYWNID